MIERQELAWRVGFHQRVDSAPEKWVPATVPGAVQLDWAASEGWPTYWQGEEFRRYAWMEDVFWTYETNLPHKASDAGRWFVCGGIDYRWEIFLEDRCLESREGMFSPIFLDLSDAPVGATLRVVIHPIPKRPSEAADRRQADRTCKPPCSYGWDWHPRLVPSGIWQEAFLLVGKGCLQEVAAHYSLDVATRRARICFACRAAGAGSGLRRVSLQSPEGDVVFSGEFPEGDEELWAEVGKLQPWWPHDHGPQPLYTATYELLDEEGGLLDVRRQRLGFRRTRLVMCDEEWSRPADLPKSRTHPPITLEINGRRIFAKGTNWVPPEIFPGRIRRERYAQLLPAARQTHFNLLRVWGAGSSIRRHFMNSATN